jgi:hypothetical protein
MDWDIDNITFQQRRITDFWNPSGDCMETDPPEDRLMDDVDIEDHLDDLDDVGDDDDVDDVDMDDDDDYEEEEEEGEEDMGEEL